MRPGPVGAGINSRRASVAWVNSLSAVGSIPAAESEPLEEEEDDEEEEEEEEELELELLDEEELLEPSPPFVSDAATKGNISSIVYGGT